MSKGFEQLRHSFVSVLRFFLPSLFFSLRMDEGTAHTWQICQLAARVYLFPSLPLSSSPCRLGLMTREKRAPFVLPPCCCAGGEAKKDAGTETMSPALRTDCVCV